jgi:hypothetical protein
VIADQTAGRLSDQPPRNVEEAFARGGRFVFLVENIFGNAPVDVPVAKAPPAVEGLSIEFFMNPQRSGTSEPDEPILIGRREIGPSGRIEFELPGGVPLFEVLRTPKGLIPMGRDGQIFHVGGHNFGVEGQTARCIGCHTGHSMLEVPRDPTLANLAPSASVIASSSRRVTNAAGVDLLQRPENLVDLRTGSVRTEWASSSPSASIELSWPLPIEAREVVIRGTSSGTGEGGARNQVIQGLGLIFLRGRERQAELNVAGPIAATGTHVPVGEVPLFDRMQVVIRDAEVSGLYEGGSGPALAEIEVLGRVHSEPRPAASFIRGDGNCDGVHEITDAILFLDWLFRGTRVLCCRAAVDSDANGETEITDAIFLLGFLFRGGPEPPAPYPDCGSVPAGGLDCDGGGVCP